MPAVESEKYDPILVEVIRNELEATVEEMRAAVRRTARSPTVQIGDFAATLFDERGRLLGLGTPHVQNIMFAEIIRRVKEEWCGDLHPGDAFVTNDPYGGGSHLPDVTIVRPVFWTGQLVGFATAYTHHVDMGGRFPGSQSGKASEIYEEGIRIPLLRIVEASRTNDAVLDLVMANVRAREDLRGDIEAKLAGCYRAGEYLIELLDKYDLDNFQSCCDYLVASAERATREIVSALPEGSYRADAVVRDDGHGPADPPLRLRITLIIENGEITADFSGTDDQARGAINMPLANLYGIVYKSLHQLLCPTVPFNSGFMAPIHVAAPLGCLVNPRYPAAVGGRAAVFFLVDEVLYRSLSLAVPNSVPVPREQWDIIHFSQRRNDGSEFAMMDLFCGGWGGGPQRDGLDGIGRYGFATPSAEIIERIFPLVIEGFGLVRDSEGAGTHRGSMAVFRRYQFLEPGTVMVRTNRIGSSMGFAGGESGKPPLTQLLRENLEVDVPAHSFAHFEVLSGDKLEHRVAGVGGYGDPWNRDESLVLKDVLEDRVSISRAKEQYGVVINEGEKEIDTWSTVTLRSGRPGRDPASKNLGAS